MHLRNDKKIGGEGQYAKLISKYDGDFTKLLRCQCRSWKGKEAEAEAEGCHLQYQKPELVKELQKCTAMFEERDKPNGKKSKWQTAVEGASGIDSDQLNAYDKAIASNRKRGVEYADPTLTSLVKTGTEQPPPLVGFLTIVPEGARCPQKGAGGRSLLARDRSEDDERSKASEGKSNQGGYVKTVLVNNVPLPKGSPLKQWTDWAQNKAKWEARKKNAPFMCEYKSPSGREWQGCTMQLKSVLSYCTTCCCKSGILSARVVNTLVFGDPSSCSAWFAGVDSLSRMITSLMRGFVTMKYYHLPCFSKRDHGIKMERTPKLGKQGKQFPFQLQREWAI